MNWVLHPNVTVTAMEKVGIMAIGVVLMRKEQEVYSMSCIGMLPFIEGSLRDGTSGLVAVSCDSEEHA